MTKAMEAINKRGIAFYGYNSRLLQIKFQEQYNRILKSVLDTNFLLQTSTSTTNLSSSNSNSLSKGSVQINSSLTNENMVILPVGSTILDYAYNCMHAKEAHLMVKAFINGHMVPFYWRLQDGDLVSLIYDNDSKGPTDQWLSWCITENASEAIAGELHLANEQKALTIGQ
jgi:(p)ppGpp synthase/HD superfamily hydrolase